MSGSLAIGDRVSWSTSRGRTHGTIEGRRTTDFQFGRQKFHASDDEPTFIVKSEKTGATASSSSVVRTTAETSPASSQP